MPVSNWNGKFQGVGGGGFAGIISYGPMAGALLNGYATASTDTGHSSPGGEFAFGHLEKLIDFAWRSEHEMTVKAKAVVEKFTKQGYKPEGYTLYTYAAFQVVAAGVKAAKSLDAKKVAEQIHGKTIDTVLGPLKYDDKGDVSNSEYVWYKWHDGKYAPIKS